MSRFAGLLCGIGALIAPAHAAAATWIAGWQAEQSLTTPRAGAAVVEARGTIYALGGIDGVDFLRSTEASRIRADGSLAPWRTLPSLHEPRGFFAAVHHGDYLYVAGGGNGPNGHHLLRSVERARILDDGGLGAWETEPQRLNLPRRCSKLVVTGRYVYAIGGFGGALLDSVERAEILPDGHLGAWRMLDDRLTLPRYVSALATTGQRVFVIGGHDERGGAGIGGVEVASIDGQRALSAWRAATPLMTGRYGLAASAWRERLYAFGGLAGATYVDSVETASVDDRGVNAWRVTTPLPAPLANLAVVTHGDQLYVIGGANRDGYSRSVHRATFNERGDIGYYGTAAVVHRDDARHRAPPPLPYQGEVLEVVQSDAYTYARLATDGGELWVAGPRTGLAIGDRVQFSRGVEMENFYSRSLQREFAVIRFVEGLERR